MELAMESLQLGNKLSGKCEAHQPTKTNISEPRFNQGVLIEVNTVRDLIKAVVNVFYWNLMQNKTRLHVQEGKTQGGSSCCLATGKGVIV